METSGQQPLSKLNNEFLQNILAQLVGRYAIIQIFYTKQSKGISHLVLHCEEKQEASQLALQKWVHKARENYNVSVSFIGSNRLRQSFASGQPFMERYCRPAALIYESGSAAGALHITREYMAYKKKYHLFMERFYNDRETRREHLQTLITENAVNSVFMAYERMFVRELSYLEELYTGNNCTTATLGERITSLIYFVPGIQQYFVNRKANSYYLIDFFTKAKEGIEQDETIFDDDMFDALSVAENGLFTLIVNRCLALKKSIKKAALHKPKHTAQKTDNPKDTRLESAVHTLAKLLSPEQIYCFHQSTCGTNKTYCLLLIGQGLGSQKLGQATRSLKSSTGQDVDFVLVGHSRYWIQKNLFRYQQFFSRIVRDENLVYASGPHHPQFHWVKPHNPYHADLHLFYRAAMQNARQFRELADGAAQSTQGLACLFTLFFLTFCKAYISAATYYLPNTLPARALWQLCLYADARLNKSCYVLDQFDGDFFGFVDRHTILNEGLYNHAGKDVSQLEMIVSRLEVTLHDLVIEGGLVGEGAPEPSGAAYPRPNTSAITVLVP